MTDKNFVFGKRRITIPAPSAIKFDNDFFEKIYTFLFDKVQNGNLNPHIDFDEFLTSSPELDILSLADAHGIKLEAAKGKNGKKAKAMLAFLKKYPEFFNLQKNLNANADVAIRAAEFVHGESVDADNFVQIKKIIDDWNRNRWTRDKNLSERQGGVSTLGSISEGLLDKALEGFIDTTNFFKNNTSEVQSYGDFVLMCLPNNLWISVKSNFARERLLASGFTTDIIGVGFFTDPTEFTSGSKLRNFQKVGFLAMYVPDIPITEDQVKDNVSTYSEIAKFYTDETGRVNIPVNINGKPFIRKLSGLSNDIENLLATADIKKRTTIGY